MASEKTTDALLKKMKDEDIKFLDLRFTDPKGKMQHVTFHSDLVDDYSLMRAQRKWIRFISKTQWLSSVTS